jgi:glycosyltransferase involved in cell wall biosynthesis
MCLEALASSLEGREYPVLVVNNGSSDDTREVVFAFEDRINLHYVVEKRTGLSHARNRALEKCATEYVVFLDDDAKPDPGWVDAIERGIETWNPDFFGGPYRPFYLQEKPPWFEDEFGSQYVDRNERELKEGEHISGGNMGWSVDLLRSIGGFPSSLGMIGDQLGLGEETYLVNLMHREYPERRGVFLPRMSMKHLVSEHKFKIKYWWKRAWQYGKQLPLIKPSKEKIGWLRAFRETSVFLRLGWRLIIRDREEYPYWRTYAMHCIGRSAVVLGAFFSPYRGEKDPSILDRSQANSAPEVVS